MVIEWTPVVSSDLLAIKYDEINCTLSIRFRNGTYSYYSVPAAVVSGLLSATSKGHYHANFIKNHFTYNRVL